MKLSGTFVLLLCALSGSVDAAEVAATNNALQKTLSMDTWYRVGVISKPRNTVENAMDTTSPTPKLVFNLRRH